MTRSHLLLQKYTWYSLLLVFNKNHANFIYFAGVCKRIVPFYVTLFVIGQRLYVLEHVPIFIFPIAVDKVGRDINNAIVKVDTSECVFVYFRNSWGPHNQFLQVLYILLMILLILLYIIFLSFYFFNYNLR